MQSPFQRAAFTLIELSIVLVIIGLLVGGTLSGQSLIHASELRRVTEEYKNYATAVNTFRDKYNGLPGDLPNAVSYWGSRSGAAGGAGTFTADLTDGFHWQCFAVAVDDGTTNTCNGDGDGAVGTGTEPDGWEEVLSFWKHLANAGLIEGHYAGFYSSGGIFPGRELPMSKYRNSAWQLGLTSTGANSETFLDANTLAQPNFLLFWSGHSAGYGILQSNLTAADASNIDTKIDDGKIDKGAVTGPQQTYYPDCTMTAADGSYQYNLTDNNPSCFMIFGNLW